MKINRGGQILPISAHEMAPMRAFSVLQKWPKIAKMTPNYLLTLKWSSLNRWGNLNITLFEFPKIHYICPNSRAIMLVMIHKLWFISYGSELMIKFGFDSLRVPVRVGCKIRKANFLVFFEVDIMNSALKWTNKSGSA